MNTESLDPLGHVAIAVSNLERSKDFYGRLFSALGFKQIRDERSTTWATREGFGMWIRQAKRDQPTYAYFAPGLQHLCVKARTQEEVNAIFRHMKSHGATVLDEPQLYPEYTPAYYAVFFADPDGMKIEVAFY